MFSASPSPTPNTDPLSISTLIKSMGEMDLHAETDCFAAWLARKHTNQHHSSTPSNSKSPLRNPAVHLRHPYAIESIEQLESMSAQDLDALLQSLVKNDSAYTCWMQKKAEQGAAKKAAAERKRTLQQQHMHRKEIRDQEMEVRRLKALQAWTDAKNRKEAQIRERKRLDREKEAKMEMEKRQEGKKAFESWLSTHPNHPTPYHNLGTSSQKMSKRPMWVSILPPPPPTETAQEDESQHSRHSLLSCQKIPSSPPAMYNDFTLHKTHAPSFFTKYKVLVASAGAPSSSPSTSSLKPKQRQKQKPALKK